MRIVQRTLVARQVVSPVKESEPTRVGRYVMQKAAGLLLRLSILLSFSGLVGAVRVRLASPSIDPLKTQFRSLSTRALSLIQGIMPRSCSPTASIW